MSELFDDLEDFGSFDDVVSGNVRDPYPELARLRREEPVQRIDVSAMPGEEGKPVFMVYRYEEAQQMLRDNETFSSNRCMDGCATWCQRRSRRRRWPVGKTSWSAASETT
jgi:cytochrome P450